MVESSVALRQHGAKPPCGELTVDSMMVCSRQQLVMGGLAWRSPRAVRERPKLSVCKTTLGLLWTCVVASPADDYRVMGFSRGNTMLSVLSSRTSVWRLSALVSPHSMRTPHAHSNSFTQTATHPQTVLCSLLVQECWSKHCQCAGQSKT